MRQVPLSRGKVALVDDDDFPMVSAFKWNAYKDRNTWYARRTVSTRLPSGERHHQTVLMHRLILGATAGQMVDHVDRDGLNNQRANLRFCTVSENSRNHKTSSANTSGFTGVHRSGQPGVWRAKIRVGYQVIELGRFDSPVLAAVAYDMAAREYFGQFARLNFPTLYHLRRAATAVKGGE